MKLWKSFWFLQQQQKKHATKATATAKKGYNLCIEAGEQKSVGLTAIKRLSPYAKKKQVDIFLDGKKEENECAFSLLSFDWWL